ncbi:hypothetical protein CoNPh10_CDS0136 [Staphylococcus phage S-CoN_Ph10]|nr:hypothetical protein CoNPh1_CDS0125 [Staphylococcus phage S-CoN_Ph1]WNM51588.1 hypothetical protein CoNPh2_CDS0034 [Staphylococcus phage S-CoN_Ph2]WNM51750.1 hypothetical protein CoNPh3_CDS0036 [Staphylococcus phage S-CoN_Ph3]WNM52012.1 hypothetical protein CoNPh4_CDS0136 [Staphylococcus phage S-CoN_Ph4]WNM52190.1 hypothetical protein CoNPh5_CDS0144 [Staphylococcus phage S-CoN_Ph5]WNM52246.1 hypothetical protein CoNPh6_CDS0036 [Staphylococcus phage S-CoN_Ph6]WNM52411.1 hypothetical protein
MNLPRYMATYICNRGKSVEDLIFYFINVIIIYKESVYRW